MPSRDSCMQPDTRNFMVHRVTFLKTHLHQMNRPQLVSEMNSCRYTLRTCVSEPWKSPESFREFGKKCVCACCCGVHYFFVTHPKTLRDASKGIRRQRVARGRASAPLAHSRLAGGIPDTVFEFSHHWHRRTRGISTGSTTGGSKRTDEVK